MSEYSEWRGEKTKEKCVYCGDDLYEGELRDYKTLCTSCYFDDED